LVAATLEGAAMDDALSVLEARVAAVEERLRIVEKRTGIGVAAEESGGVALNEGMVSNASSHLGRVLLIFGGAFLLRAMTDSQVVPTGLGIFLGASYAMVWLFMAYRAGGIEGRKAGALFFAVSSTLLTLPLLAEAVTKFDLLSGAQGAIALSVFCGLALLVSVLRDMRILAWLISAGGVGTALYLLGASHTAQAFVAFLLLLAMGCLWAVYQRTWRGPQWIAALGVNAGVVALVLLSSNEGWDVAYMEAFGFAVALLLAYLVSFAVRTHIHGEDVGAFEVVQAIVAVGLLVYVAGEVSRGGHINLVVVGFLALVLGAVIYGLGFTPRTLAARGPNFFFYSTLGLMLVAAGSAIVLTPGIAAAGWAALALVLAWFSGRQGMVTLSLQCSLLLIAAGFVSGVLSTGFLALAGNGAESWPSVVSWQVVVALATVGSLFIPVAQRSTRWGKLAGMPQIVVLVLAVWEVGGLLVLLLAPSIAGVPGTEADLAVLAALRTSILAASAITLAISSRHKRWPEARWLVYPMLILVGAKLIIEDFPHGKPATLFVSLAAVGSAMIFVSWWMSNKTEPRVRR
jgi:hypothetical protein